MATLSKALNASFTVLSVTCLALYLAGMLTPVVTMGDAHVFIWGKSCPSGKSVGDKSCVEFKPCDKTTSLMQASQAFFILSDIGSLAAAGAGAAVLLGKVPSVAAIGAAAATFLFGTITMGVTFSLWTQKQCGSPLAFSKVDGVKMGNCLKLLIAAYVISFAALVVAIVGHLKGGSAGAQEAGDVAPSKVGVNDGPVRQEPPASTLVPVQAHASHNPLDKEQPKAPEQPKVHEQPKVEEKSRGIEVQHHEQPSQQAQEAEQKRAKVLAIDFEAMKLKLPATKGDEAQKAQRFAMFDRIDAQASGKGALTLQEVTVGLRDVLQVGDTVASLDQVIAKAFAKAAAAGQAAAGNEGGEGAATVEKNEFRLLLLYVRQYFRVFQIFAQIDTTGDNRMALDEFRAAQHDFASMGLAMADADATFHAIDADKSGVVDFHEFAMWALDQDGVLSG